MPRPAILSSVDWKEVFEAGQSYADWLACAENGDERYQMEESRRSIAPNPAQEAYLRALPRVVHVIAIAEAWCGDVRRHVPVLQKLSECARHLHVRYITRDLFPDVFVRHLTNGGEAIPKFIFLSDQFVECGNWGPMPADCRRLIARGKAAGDLGAARKRVSKMYEADPACEVVIAELLELIDTAICVSP
jgi:hypothetical protein